MTVKELIKILEEQNPDAKVEMFEDSVYAWVTVLDVIATSFSVRLYPSF